MTRSVIIVVSCVYDPNLNWSKMMAGINFGEFMDENVAYLFFIYPKG